MAIENSQLPKAVIESFAKAYPGFKIKEAEKLETPAQKELYELEIMKGAEKAEIRLLPDGEIISRENSKD